VGVSTLYLPLTFYVKETPRYFLGKRNYKQSLKQFECIARRNLKDRTQLKGVSLEEPVCGVQKLYTIIDILRYKSLRYKFIFISLLYIIFCFNFYGLALALAELDGNIFLNGGIAAAAGVVSNPIVAYISNIFGRKKTLIGTSLVSGFFCMIYPFIPNQIAKYFIYFMIRFTVSGCYTVIASSVIELFPTVVI
jgi:hypothetical protein